MQRTGFRLGIDFGTSHTVGPPLAGRAGPATAVRRSPLLPSAVYVQADGRFVVGRDALDSARLDPGDGSPARSAPSTARFTSGLCPQRETHYMGNRASWVVGSGSLPQGVGPDFYATLGNRVRDAGARFALDSSGPALTAGLAARPHLIKPNIDELAEAVGRPISRLGDAVAAGQELVQRGAGCVVVSLGPDGALLIDGTQAVHAETHVAHPP